MEKKTRNVLVTGAGNGIGLAITEFLSQRSIIVIAADYDKDSLKKFAERENIIPIYLDVRKNDTILEAAEEISSKVDGLDCLVNNAGIFLGGSLLDIDLNELARIFDINVIGYARITQAMFPLLHKKKGKIINISSEVGRFSFPFNGPYSMTKFAIESFSDSLRRELMFLGMKVIIIQPGAIQTQLSGKTIDEYSKYRQEDYIFSEQINRLWPILEKETYSDPINVAKVVYKIIRSKRPKNRYRVKNNKQRRMLEFFPSSWADFLIKYLI